MRWTTLFLTVLSPLALAADLRVADLRCESQTDPLAVDAARPRLSWILQSGTRGQCQTVYQIVVASTQAGLRREQGDLWDSGTIESDAQNQVEYAGKRLISNAECFWKVRVWDKDGKPSAWSQPARWGMGLVAPQDWKAKWIRAEDQPPWPLPLFRREFVVNKPVRRMVVHVCGLGQFDLFLDGQKVGDHFLDPAWSAFEKTLYYSTFDITRQLAPGRHAFGVMLGKGFYNTAGDRRVHGVNATRPLKLLLQARLTYTDGTEQTVLIRMATEVREVSSFVAANWRLRHFLVTLPHRPKDGCERQFAASKLVREEVKRGQAGQPGRQGEGSE